MEINQKPNLKELATHVNMLENQNDDFLKQYIVTIIQKGRIIHENRNYLFMPYVGKDESLIIRLFRKFIAIKYPIYSIDENNLNVLIYLIKIHTKEAEKPGLILWGPTGTGKTALLHVWFEFRVKILSNPSIAGYIDNNRLNNPHLERILNKDTFNTIHITPENLITNYKNAGSTYPRKVGDALFIDDMGVNNEIIDFGNKLNLLEQLISARYNIFKQDSSFEFYGTTNWKNEDQLKKGVGERAYSRLCEMAEWDEGLLNGNDRRKKKNNLKEWPKIENRGVANLW